MFGLKSCFVILVIASVSYGQGININVTCVPPTTTAATTNPTTTPTTPTTTPTTATTKPGNQAVQTKTTASTTQTTPTTTTTTTTPTTTTIATAGRKRRQAPGACIEHASCTTVNKQSTCQCDNNYQAANITTCIPMHSAARGMTKASATVLATSFLLAAIFKFM